MLQFANSVVSGRMYQSFIDTGVSDVGKLQDLTGRAFGKLTVVARAENFGRMTAWFCQCDCGNEKVVRATHLKRGEIKSCGCAHKDAGIARRVDITRERYGRLVVQSWDEGRFKWLCQCDCGNTHWATTNDIRTGHTTSCGCAHVDAAKTNLKLAQAMEPKHKLRLQPGDRKHKLTITGFSHIADSHTHWNADCDCGNTTVVRGSTFNKGRIMSCGCAIGDASRERGVLLLGTINEAAREKAAEKYIGQRFGKVVITGLEWKSVAGATKGSQFANYQCDCGGTGVARTCDLLHGKVSTCGCGVNVSKDEQEIFDWLSQKIECTQQQKIDGWRYDIAIPSKKIVIEYNGVWWHSSGAGTYKKKHLIKRRVAEGAGWRLVTIWSDDYMGDPEKWKGFIERTLGLVELNSVGARKFNIHYLDRDLAMAHHAAHHVQIEKPPGGIHVGAYLGDKLIAAMTVRVEQGQHVISRYTIAQGYTSPGLLLRLMKRVSTDKPCAKWVSYCDMDHFSGGLYKAAGFEQEGYSLQLTYTYGGTRVRRERFMKHKLERVFDEVDMSKTEKEICAENGVHQVFNSGIVKYVKQSQVD